MVMPKMIRALPEELVEDGGATAFGKFDRLMKRLLKVPKAALDKRSAATKKPKRKKKRS